MKDENGDVCTRPLGFMAGHVDDFHRAGNENSAAWKQIKQSIDQRYKWGGVKLNAYRHAGTDLEIVNDATLGRCLVVDQSYYVETLQDIDITPERFCQGDATMTPKEISACRTSLGALQWLAVQTQPLICARCNLLITELAGSPVMRTAQEIQELARDFASIALSSSSSSCHMSKLGKMFVLLVWGTKHITIDLEGVQLVESLFF